MAILYFDQITIVLCVCIIKLIQRCFGCGFINHRGCYIFSGLEIIKLRSAYLIDDFSLLQLYQDLANTDKAFECLNQALKIDDR